LIQNGAVRVLLLLVLSACDDGMAAPDLSSLPPDLAMLGVDGGINCGNTSCALGVGVICCIEAVSQYCAPPAACSAGLSAYCDGPEDCGGGSCCHFDDTLISCSMQCPGAIVCHGDGDCPSGHCCDQGGYRACAATCS
jgi:hypothetical protein